MIVFNIENIRKSKGISLNKLHKLTGISRSYLFDLENNRRTNPSLIMLEKIAKILDVKVKDLFFETVEIEALKKEMYNRIDTFGLDSPQVLEVSQIIDLLVNIKMNEE